MWPATLSVLRKGEKTGDWYKCKGIMPDHSGLVNDAAGRAQMSNRQLIMEYEAHEENSKTCSLVHEEHELDYEQPYHEQNVYRSECVWPIDA
ncbi:hypothetical protein Tco_0980237 [Tanacetum coccineum]